MLYIQVPPPSSHPRLTMPVPQGDTVSDVKIKAVGSIPILDLEKGIKSDEEAESIPAFPRVAPTRIEWHEDTNPATRRGDVGLKRSNSFFKRSDSIFRRDSFFKRTDSLFT